MKPGIFPIVVLRLIFGCLVPENTDDRYEIANDKYDVRRPRFSHRLWESHSISLTSPAENSVCKALTRLNYRRNDTSLLPTDEIASNLCGHCSRLG